MIWGYHYFWKHPNWHILLDIIGAFAFPTSRRDALWSSSPCLATTEKLGIPTTHLPKAGVIYHFQLSIDPVLIVCDAPEKAWLSVLSLCFLALKASPVKTVGAPTYPSHNIEQQQAWADGDVSNICSLVILLKIIFRISLAEAAIAGDADKKYWYHPNRLASYEVTCFDHHIPERFRLWADILPSGYDKCWKYPVREINYLGFLRSNIWNCLFVCLFVCFSF